MTQAEAEFNATGTPARVFKDFRYRTRHSWTSERRVVGKAEFLEKGANPRFCPFTSLVVANAWGPACALRSFY